MERTLFSPIRIFSIISSIPLAERAPDSLVSQKATYLDRILEHHRALAAIDAEVSEADIQGVAIQRKILLGEDITRRLALEGLVLVFPRRGTFASAINITSLSDITDVRSVLEAHAAARAATLADAGDVEAARRQAQEEAESQAAALQATLEAAEAARTAPRPASGAFGSQVLLRSVSAAS